MSRCLNPAIRCGSIVSDNMTAHLPLIQSNEKWQLFPILSVHSSALFIVARHSYIVFLWTCLVQLYGALSRAHARCTQLFHPFSSLAVLESVGHLTVLSPLCPSLFIQQFILHAEKLSWNVVKRLRTEDQNMSNNENTVRLFVLNFMSRKNNNR